MQLLWILAGILIAWLFVGVVVLIGFWLFVPNDDTPGDEERE